MNISKHTHGDIVAEVEAYSHSRRLLTSLNLHMYISRQKMVSIVKELSTHKNDERQFFFNLVSI